MQILLDILTLIAKILILIGDLVLFLIKLIVKTIKTINKWFYKLFFLITILLKRIILKIENITSSLKNFLSLPNLKLRLTFRKAGFLKNGTRKRRKIKPINIFPLPLGIKIKYFLLGSIFSFIFLFIPLLFLIFLQDLPSPKILSLVQEPQTTKIYDRNGTLLYQIYANQNRTLVPLSSIPKYVQEATIAIEDKDFYKNPGFDIFSIVRAAAADLKGEPLQGGSTITQQLIKSTLLIPELTITRKVKELILALWTERIYPKDKILEMYLNQIPYGGTAWGIEAAAETYFGKHAKDLDLAESAVLAGLPNAPSLYSPYGQYPNLWKTRQKEVLQKMVELKYITKQKQKEAEKENLAFQSQQIPIYAPHFVMYVKDLLVKKYGLPMVERGGLSVRTSLDLKLQEMAQNIVKGEVDKDAYLNLTNGAALITDPKNGDILAMVGSRDYSDPNGGNFNVTDSLRQPGSSIKVVTYSAALSNGYTAATTIDDSPITFSSGSIPYSPVNYDGRFRGIMTLRNALANSVNVPAVKTLNAIGIPKMVELAKKMGITTWGDQSQYGLSITLGGADVKMLDMATVYGVLANEGYRVNLNPILKLTDSSGNVLEEKNQVQKEEVVDPGVAYIISNILADNNARSMEFGINSPLLISGRTVSVKTGTSDNKRDNWTIGYTPSYVVAVWVGNNNNNPMSQELASGITGAAPIWRAIMENLLSTLNDEKMSVPSDVIQKPCRGKNEYFIRGTENLVNCAPLPSPSLTPEGP